MEGVSNSRRAAGMEGAMGYYKNQLSVIRTSSSLSVFT